MTATQPSRISSFPTGWKVLLVLTFMLAAGGVARSLTSTSHEPTHSVEPVAVDFERDVQRITSELRELHRRVERLAENHDARKAHSAIRRLEAKVRQIDSTVHRLQRR